MFSLLRDFWYGDLWDDPPPPEPERHSWRPNEQQAAALEAVLPNWRNYLQPDSLLFFVVDLMGRVERLEAETRGELAKRRFRYRVHEVRE